MLVFFNPFFLHWLFQVFTLEFPLVFLFNLNGIFGSRYSLLRHFLVLQSSVKAISIMTVCISIFVFQSLGDNYYNRMHIISNLYSKAQVPSVTLCMCVQKLGLSVSLSFFQPHCRLAQLTGIDFSGLASFLFCLDSYGKREKQQGNRSFEKRLTDQMCTVANGLGLSCTERVQGCVEAPQVGSNNVIFNE